MSPLGLWKKRILARFITRLKMNSSQLGLCVDNKHDINCNITSLNYRPCFITTNIPFLFVFNFLIFFFRFHFQPYVLIPFEDIAFTHLQTFRFKNQNLSLFFQKSDIFYSPTQLHTTPLIICSIFHSIHKSTIQQLLILTHCPPLPALLPLPPKI